MELIDKKALVKYLVEVRNKIYAGDFDENIAELNYCPYCGAIMDGVEK